MNAIMVMFDSLNRRYLPPYGHRHEVNDNWFEDYGAEAILYTDIGRDGMLVGPDLDGLARSAELAGAPVIASGGVSSLDDVIALTRIENLGGVITGKALYEGRFTISEALAAVGSGSS